ncbi:hypothetical protein V1515DRAFT_611413 [Lipomyces mesembrius]
MLPMSSAIFQCTACNHAPFNTKAKLNKHSSSKHRKAATFNSSGKSFPLLVTDNNKYVCPACKAEKSSVSGLRRHMGSQNCRTNQDVAGSIDLYQPEDRESELYDSDGNKCCRTLEGTCVLCFFVSIVL